MNSLKCGSRANSLETKPKFGISTVLLRWEDQEIVEFKVDRYVKFRSTINKEAKSNKRKQAENMKHTAKLISKFNT